MIFSYHTSFENRKAVADCKSAQIMLNNRKLPTNTHLVDDWGNANQMVVLHQDYYRTPLRYFIMKHFYQRQFMEELVMFLKSDSSKWSCNFKGVVVHADTVFGTKFAEQLMQWWRSGSLTKEWFYALVNLHYHGQIYDDSTYIADKMWSIIYALEPQQDPLKAIETYALKIFLQDLEARMQGKDTQVKVYFENTTKGLHGDSMMGRMPDFLYLDLGKYCSLCLDVEHGFASGWFDGANWADIVISAVESGRVGCVHLNTIPRDVQWKSYRDRHSTTMLHEGQFFIDDYVKVQRALDSYNIPTIREVDPDIREREMEWTRHQL